MEAIDVFKGILDTFDVVRSIQIRWSQCLPSQTNAAPKWYCTSKGLLGAGPGGIMAADAILTESGALHIAGVPILNLSTVVWEVAPLAAYLFIWQEYQISEAKQGKKHANQDFTARNLILLFVFVFFLAKSRR